MQVGVGARRGCCLTLRGPERHAAILTCWRWPVAKPLPSPSLACPSRPAPPQGEQATAAAFEGDPYGCSPALRAKRLQRDPFAAGGYNGERCPDMAELLGHCGPALYDGPLPWDGTA